MLVGRALLAPGEYSGHCAGDQDSFGLSGLKWFQLLYDIDVEIVVEFDANPSFLCTGDFCQKMFSYFLLPKLV